MRKLGRKAGGATKQVSDTTSFRDRGSSYIAKRLARDRMDLFQRVRAGELSLHAAGIRDDATGPLFRSAVRYKRNALTANHMRPADVHRMVKRSLKRAGLPEVFSCHSFRAGVATSLLEQDIPLTAVRDLLGHSDTRTTEIYDRRSRETDANLVAWTF